MNIGNSLDRRIVELRFSLIEFAVDHSLEELLIKALDEIEAFVDSRIAFYHFVEPDQKTLSLQQWSTRTLREFCRAEARGMQYSVEKAGVWVDCVRKGKPVIHNDYASLPHKKGMPEGHATVVRELVVPVRREGDIVAILGVGNKPTDYTSEDVDIVSYLADVTYQIVRQKRVEASLRESEERYRLLVESIHDSIFAFDNEWRLVFVNATVEKVVGAPREKLLGTKLEALFPGIEHTPSFHVFHRVKRTGKPEVVVDEHVFSHRGEAIFEVDVYPSSDGILCIARDITARRRTERLVAAERERLAVTLRSIGDGVITTDVEGKVVVLNRVAEELTGWKQREAAGKPLDEVYRIVDERTHEPCENPVSKVMQSSEIVEGESDALLIARDGVERLIADSAAPIRDKAAACVGVVLVFRDVTEKRNFSDALHRADKMASLGVLAGGIAHDFNNLLGGVFGYIQLAQRVIAEGSPAEGYLAHALTAFERAKGLTDQLLTFAKGGAPVREVGDVEKMVRENVTFALAGANVACTYDIAPQVWYSDFDANQMGRVIDNLVMNATQAMPRGGAIRVSLANVALADGEVGALPAGRYVRVSVTDRGGGISAEIRERIFDPFFTTKRNGSGLGLATTFSIVQKHDGHIGVESVVDKGTTFHVYLPAADCQMEESVPQVQATARGGGTVLILDDEACIREIASQMLSEMGYAVLVAADGQEALRLCDTAVTDGVSIQVAIFDLTIPGAMGGREAGEVMRKKYPSIPILASSGYSDDPIMSKPIDYGFAGSIPKPYRLDELRAAVSKAVGGADDGRSVA